MSWSEGYAAGTGYTHGYYRQLNPVFAGVALTSAGVAARPVRHACELGFGQGLSLAVHAAASGCSWWGTDFMPGHAHFAAALAGDGAAALFDQSFAEFCARPDLPMFDFIGMHGIWSWVSDENRRIITDFVRRKLNPGGTLYVSYNTAAGWAGLLPLREVLVRHVRTMGRPGDDPMLSFRAALGFVRGVFEAKSVYAAHNPIAPAMLSKMLENDGTYVLHEYLGQHWKLMHVAEVAEGLGAAKLAYACSARLVDHVPELGCLAEQGELLASIPDPIFRETVRDVLVAERFRQDYWVKGPRPIDGAEHGAALARARFVLVEPPEAVAAVRPTTPLGEIDLPRAAFAPYLEALADNRPRSVAELGRLVGRAGDDLAEVVRAVLVLTHIGAVQPAHPTDEAVAAAAAGSARLNDAVLARARWGGELCYLANPVTGGATHVPRAQQLFLLAEREGHTDPATHAAYAGAVLHGPDAPLSAELLDEARAFGRGRRAVLARLGVA